MIGSIYSGSASITVSGGTASTYVNGYSGSQGVGNMRYNTTNQRTEVFDGTNWVQLNMSSVTVALSGETESLLQWARHKRNEEMMLDQLAEENPTIKDLVDQIKQKQDQIKMVRNLIKKENEWESEQVQAGP